MLQHDILKKRNTFVFYTVIAINFIYFAMILLGLFENLYTSYFAFTVSMIVVLTLLFLLGVNQRVIQVTLVLTWNISAFLLIYESCYLITFFGFICILLIITIYNSPILTTILLSVMSFETIIVLKLKYAQFLMNTDQDKTISMFFIAMILLMCSLQVIFIRKIWGKQERSTLSRELELSSREGYLRLFFENADDAIAVFDLQRKIIDVNPAFEKLYGWSREECLGKSLPLVPPKNINDANNRYECLLNGESFRLVNTQDMRKDGTLIDVQISLSPITNGHGEMIASSVISRDISYQKENERLIMQSEKLKAVGEMAAGLAHEIRNPMTVISGFVQMMNADENFPYKTYTTLIQTEVERINLIISEFLVLSKPQKEKYTKFLIYEVIDGIVDLFSLQIQQKNINITVKTNGINPYIKGSYNQIKQVFINLLKNAIEAIDENGKIQIETYLKDGHVYIYLKDNGTGIPEHIVDRIFEPFFTTKESGTGLGMVVTNKIIQEHKGTLQIRSKEKIGTEVLIKIPYADLEETVTQVLK